MDRRNFLKMLGVGAATAVMPKVFEASPAVESVVEKAADSRKAGNKVVSIDEITREALRILHDKLVYVENQWSAKQIARYNRTDPLKINMIKS